MAADAEPVRPLWLAVGAVLATVGGWAATALPFAEGVDPGRGGRAVGATIFVAVAWLSRSMPLGAASLLPIALFPLLGVRPTALVTADYANPILWLFFGGFVLALCIERWGLHRRIALQVLAAVGPHPRRLVLGFLGTGLLLSMWISNTATSLMLLPIGWALVDRIRDEGLLDPSGSRAFGIATMLGIGYGCSVGGMATPIGTAPNALFFSTWRGLQARESAAEVPSVTFLDWLLAFAPFAVVFGLVIWIVLTRVSYRVPAERMAADDLVAEAHALPRMTAPQRRVACLFGLAVLLWVTRGDVNLGSATIPGWATLLFPDGATGPAETMPGARYVLDASVAIGIAVLAFLVPSGSGDRRRLMDWEGTRDLPYDILFLLGGGIAIAGAFAEAGVSQAFGAVVAPWIGEVSPIVVVLGICLLITFLTEVTSNTAITSLFLPILLAASIEAEVDPRFVMLPATIAASCAFMFPIATPPNAVVFSSGKVTFGQMAKAGLVLNVVSVVLLTAYLWWVGFAVLGVDPDGGMPW